MIKFYPGATGTITSLISAVTTLIPLSSALADILSTLGVGNWTYLLLKNGDDTEVVKVTAISSTIATIERNIDASGAKAFPSGTAVSAFMPYSAVADIIAEVGAPADITFIEEGAVEITVDGDEVTINVPQVEVTAVENGGIDVLGTYPEFSIALSNPTGCCPTTGSETAVSLVGFGLATVEQESPTTFSITVETPNFTGEDGIEVTGTWPDIVIGFSGDVGTLLSITAGTGLVKTGPTNTPTLSIAASGVVAGTYGGVVINAQGQLTAVPATFNPVSIIAVTASTGLSINRVADAVTLAGIDADVGVKGVVALADSTDPLDPGDDATAVTPALLAAVLDDLQGTDIDGGQTYNGEPDASYTNVLPATVVTIDIPAGGKALIIASVVVKNNADVTDIPEYGIAIFNTVPVRLFASPILKQQMQIIHAVISGPAIHTLALVTTDLTGYSANSNSIQVIVI